MLFWKRKKDGPVEVAKRYVAALNARDADAMIALLHPDPVFVDSRGYCIEGYEDSVDGVRALLDLDAGFRMHVDSYALHHGDVLMRGETEADDPRLAHDTLWLAKVEDGRIRYWQSFGDSNSPALAHILLPERSRAAHECGHLRQAV